MTPKKEPTGWMGTAKLPTGKWVVIDSTGSTIAGIGFDRFPDQAHALRWIDGYQLLRAGRSLPPDEIKEIHRQQHDRYGPGRKPDRVRASSAAHPTSDVNEKVTKARGRRR